MMDKKAEKLLKDIDEVLASEGISIGESKEDEFEMIEKYSLPAIQNLKEIQSALYNDFYVGGKGLKGKVKGKVIKKIANITRNTVELALMRQQKFNDSVVLILEYLVKENKRLREEKNV